MKTSTLPQRRKATHVYVGRKACGCCVAVVTDLQDKMTGKEVAEFIASGLTVERISFDDYRARIVEEPGFMGCIHEEGGEQLVLLQVGERDETITLRR